MQEVPSPESFAPQGKPEPNRLALRLLPYVVFLFAAIRAVNIAAVQMPFNGWDELSHIAVAYYVHSHGHMPALRTPMPRDLKPFIEAHPHPAAAIPMLSGTDARPYPGGDPTCSSEPPRRFRMSLYQSQHGPLFYHFMASFLTSSDPESLLAWVDGGRIFNITLLLGTLFLWRCILRRVVPVNGQLAWLPDGVMLLLVSFSYVFYNFVRFANDALALFLGTAALALYSLWIKPKGLTARGQPLRFVLLGGITGLAVLAKATSLILIPVFVGVLVGQSWVAWANLKRRSTLSALAGSVAFLLSYAAVAGHYHLECLARYGQLTGMQEAVINSKLGYGQAELMAAATKLNYGLFHNPILYNSTPHQAGWSNLVSPQWINMGFKTALVACALALCLGLTRQDSRRAVRALFKEGPELPLLMAVGIVALFYHAIQSTLCWGFPTTGAWYGMIFLPVLFLLVLLGPALCGRQTSVCCLLFLVLICNVAYMGGTYDTLLTQETGSSDFFKAIKIAVSHHALLRPDLHVLLLAEFLCLIVSLGLVTSASVGEARIECAYKTVGESIDEAFQNPQWESGKASDGDLIVNATGIVTWQGKRYKAVIQFSPTQDGFKTLGISFNGQVMDEDYKSKFVT